MKKQYSDGLRTIKEQSLGKIPELGIWGAKGKIVWIMLAIILFF